MPDKALKQRAGKIARLLKKRYPDAHCALNFSDPLELLVATILSAQCTDVRVNIVTKGLFKKYKSARAYAKADVAELEEDIRTTGFFRNKSKNIRKCCAALVDKHGGKVPDTMEELVALSGVGRKTANVILGNAYGVPGIPVDTHVKRVSNRLGLSANSDPNKIEQDLMRLVSKRGWTLFSHMMIFHGRQVCSARSPKCDGCLLLKHCDYGQGRATV
ncbi:endonuclease III [Candidatus Hydrogenedentota bacterium]